MAVTPDRPAPYAPLSTILDVIARYRDRGLPPPITKEVLARSGVPETLVPRVLQALVTLDLIGEDGQPTPVFEGIRRAPETEYKPRLKEWLDAAYADALNYVDPATASETEIRDAFRNYNPVGQQPRMVALFTGLYAEAGIGPERQPTAPKQRSFTAPRAVRTPSPFASKPGVARKQHSSKTDHSIPDGLPAPLAGLLSQLPAADKGWTKERRDSFVATFGHVLDFCFPIVAADESDADNEEEDAA